GWRLAATAGWSGFCALSSCRSNNRKSPNIAAQAPAVATASQNAKMSAPRVSTARLLATASSPGSVLCIRCELRIVDGQERTLLELPEENREPDAADPDRGGEAEPVELKVRRSRRGAGLGEDGRDEPEDVHQPHRHDEGRDRREQPRIAVGGLGQEQQEGECEMQDDERRPDPAPSAREPAQVPRNLLG